MNDPLAHWLAHPPTSSDVPPVGEAARRLQRRSTILDWFQIGALALIPIVLFLAFRVDNRAEHADKRAARVADTVAAFRDLVVCDSPAACADARRKLAVLGQPSAPTTTTSSSPSTLATVPPSDRTTQTGPAAPAARSATPTTTTPSPPVSSAPAPTQPPPPSSTTTTTACANRVAGRCLPPLKKGP